jgi:hypothetical protein
VRFWFNLLYLCVGLWFLGQWFLGRVAPRTRKNPFLYFGIGVICSGIADLLPPSAARLSGWLEIVATLALLVAAVFFFVFAEPAKAKPSAADTTDA